MKLTKEQIIRYRRNIILKNIGVRGQCKLLSSKVLIIGLGGLGSPAALYLSAAGVGAIGIADSDRVDLTNLQRQIIHSGSDLGKLKTVSALEKIKKLNPDVKIFAYQKRITRENILDIIDKYDFVLDCTDNYDSKFLINDACVAAKKPYSHAGVMHFEGQTMTYVPGSACYRCLFDVPPPKDVVASCSGTGILGAVAGILGSIQATEALKYILNTGNLLTNKILKINALSMDFIKVSVKKDPSCPACGRITVSRR